MQHFELSARPHGGCTFTCGFVGHDRALLLEAVRLELQVLDSQLVSCRFRIHKHIPLALVAYLAEPEGTARLRMISKVTARWQHQLRCQCLDQSAVSV